MLNQSDLQFNRADAAEIAQLLRGGDVFGSVAYSEIATYAGVVVQIERGYGDCLPILGGGCWRDPASVNDVETIE